MVLSVIHGLRPNQKLKSILEGCTNLTHLWGSTLTAHNLFSQPFFRSQSVYLRFTHIMNMQPKFYIGSAMHHTLDREYSRSRKFCQLTNGWLVHSELALPYWQEHDNLYIWDPIPIYTERSDYRCLELAWSKNGNLAWTTFANFSIHEKAPSKNLQWTPTINSDWPLSGVAPNTGSHHRWSKISSPRKDSNIVWNSGPSSTPWDQTQKQDSSNPKCSGPTTEVLPCAMLYDDWPTTFRNHTALFPSKPSMHPSNGGKGNRHHVLQLSGLFGFSAQTFNGA